MTSVRILTHLAMSSTSFEKSIKVALLWNRRSQIFDDNLSLGVDAQYSMDTDTLYSWSLVLELGLFLKILVVLQSTMITSGTGAKMCKVLKGGKVWCCSEAVYWCLTVYKATGCEAPVCPMACGSNPVSTEVCYAEGNAVVSNVNGWILPDMFGLTVVLARGLCKSGQSSHWQALNKVETCNFVDAMGTRHSVYKCVIAAIIKYLKFNVEAGHQLVQTKHNDNLEKAGSAASSVKFNHY